MSLSKYFFNIQPSIIEKTKQKDAYQEKYKGHILKQESYSSNSIGVSLHTDTKECTDWLLKHMSNSKEGIKLTVEPIKENATYVTISVDGSVVSHIKCKDFRFIHDDYEGYLRFTTETIPTSLFNYCRKYGYESMFDVIAYGTQYNSQIRIDAKECKLISGINIDSEKPVELYFQVPEDYILDIT